MSTANDSLRLRTAGGGGDMVFLRAVGTIPGVVITFASARNGGGQGRLIRVAGCLAWQAPGSPVSGPIVATPVDGLYVLADGADPSKYVRAQVYTAWLGGTGDAVVTLSDNFNTFAGTGAQVTDDVAAADAAAGLVTTSTYALSNLSANDARNVKLWLDIAGEGAAALAVSSDGTNFYHVTGPNQANVPSWPKIAHGASVPVYVRRTIAAATPSDPRVLSVLDWEWEGLS
jgi:hypothetical protein